MHTSDVLDATGVDHACEARCCRELALLCLTCALRTSLLLTGATVRIVCMRAMHAAVEELALSCVVKFACAYAVVVIEVCGVVCVCGARCRCHEWHYCAPCVTVICTVLLVCDAAGLSFARECARCCRVRGTVVPCVCALQVAAIIVA